MTKDFNNWLKNKEFWKYAKNVFQDLVKNWFVQKLIFQTIGLKLEISYKVI